MARLGHQSPKAERILAVAGELLLSRGSRGVVMAEVARKAQVGQGTAYLYWKNKDDLLLELVARDFLSLIEEVAAKLAADSELILPSRLCRTMLEISPQHPFVGALLTQDVELLGVLTDDPRSAALLEALGPDAVMHTVLPIWREGGLSSTDWPSDDQARALTAVLRGFTDLARADDQADRRAVGGLLSATVKKLLSEPDATGDQISATAEAAAALLADIRALAEEMVRSPRIRQM